MLNRKGLKAVHRTVKVKMDYRQRLAAGGGRDIHKWERRAFMLIFVIAIVLLVWMIVAPNKHNVCC